MCWLPMFMVSAHAMSLQMVIQQVNSENQAMGSMPCHQDYVKQSESTSCLGCGFCAIASSIANFGQAPTFYIPTNSSTAPMMIDVIYESCYHSSTYRPPILS